MLVEIVEALDLEVGFAVAGQVGIPRHAPSRTGMQILPPVKDSKTKCIEVQVKFGTHPHGSEDDAWFVGNDLFQCFAVIVSFKLAVTQSLIPFLFKSDSEYALQGKQIFEPQLRIEQKIAKRCERFPTSSRNKWLTGCRSAIRSGSLLTNLGRSKMGLDNHCLFALVPSIGFLEGFRFLRVVDMRTVFIGCAFETIACGRACKPAGGG